MSTSPPSNVLEAPGLPAVERRVGKLSGLIAAATAELVSVLGEVLAEGSWQGHGIRSPEHWAVLRCGVSHAHARRLVAMAEALPALPATTAAFADGALSEDHVSEIVRAGLEPRNDDDAVTLARQLTVPQLRRALTTLPSSPVEREPGDEAPVGSPTQPVARRVTYGGTEDGAWSMHAILSPEEGALIEAGLGAAHEAEFRDGNEHVTWADALVRLASVGTDHLDPQSATGRPASERYQVHVHLDAERLDARWHLGARLPDAVRRQLLCDSTIRPWVHQPDGSVNQGHRSRVVSPRLRLVVEHRDGGCRVPGCGVTRGLHIHHIVHWEDHGPTETPNLVAVCARHHRAIHRGDLHVEGNADLQDGLVYRRRCGRELSGSPPTPPVSEPSVEAAQLGIDPTGTASRSGERLQLRWVEWSRPGSMSRGP